MEKVINVSYYPSHPAKKINTITIYGDGALKQCSLVQHWISIIVPP
ncbi:hypothetical protein [Methanosarcina sp. DH2]|jgi:hypothetical protein|nr:hypothetical protein [Methanosarcina sp. DH2]